MVGAGDEQVRGKARQERPGAPPRTSRQALGGCRLGACALLAVLLGGILGSAAHAAVTIRELGPDELASIAAAQDSRELSLSPRVSLPASQLVLPFYRVDRTRASGDTTLFAVRNISNQTVTVRYRYTQGSSVALTELLSLAPRATRTVNLRDLSLPVLPSGLSVGAATIAVVDALGRDLNNPVLTGDYFLVDPADDFASGSELITVVCRGWHTRFFNGGAFSGGSLFTFFVDSLAANNVIATALVYAESGALRGGFQLTSIAGRVEAVTTGQLEAQLPGLLGNFGSIEWTLASLGVVTQTFSALGRFSVGAPATCVN